MSDKKKIGGGSSGDGAFERDLVVSSHAYKHVDGDLPPPALDDAIRAAARRAVNSKPHPVGKSWAARWSAPISAAALLVLTVSVVLTGIEEKPDLAPVTLNEMSLPRVATPANTEADAARNRAPSEASRPTQPAPLVEMRMPVETQNTALRDQLAKPLRQDTDRRRNDAAEAGVSSAAVDAKPTAATSPVKEKRDSLPESAPSPTAPSAIGSAKLLAKDAPGFVAAPPPAQIARSPESTAAASAEQAKREVAQEKPLKSALVAGAAAGSIRNEAAALADKATEPPEVWLKRIRELKQQGKTREFEEELSKFRKRFPDFALPEDLKTAK